MHAHPDLNEATFLAWLDTRPSEDELRDAYLTLEAARAQLWTPGHIDSYRRDRFERDAVLVRNLVHLKRALADTWQSSGQVPDHSPV